MSKPVYCEKCAGEIKYRDDLVTATSLLQVVPYHDECYSKDLKGVNTLFLDNQPLNGFSSNFMTAVISILMIGWLIFAEGSMKWVSIVFLVPIIYRLYSYLTYERHLEK